MKRSSGILLPVFSLPSEYGMGSFGKESYEFIDFLKKARQKVWQILPLVQTGWGNSPYSSIYSESFNPFFISLETLKSKGLIDKKDLDSARIFGKYIDYDKIYAVRYPILRKAFSRFNKDDESFKKFLKSGEFTDYALYMALKEKNSDSAFYDWEDKYKYRNKTALKTFYEENKDEVLFWQFVQYEAKAEWLALKDYAGKNGIKIFGDMPLYVAADSVDVWVNPELFKLNDDLKPRKVAGVPPDYFSAKGQLWGNPVYDYEKHKEDNFSWWIKRLKKALKIFDLVRIDHFRGLDRFWEVDSGKEDAIEGVWVDVPSRELFDRIHDKIGRDRIIAEDLGIIDDGVRELLRYTGYPGMKVLSFAFNGEPDNLYLPENIGECAVCYTGTHDNDTLMGLLENYSDWDRNNIIQGVSRSLGILGIDGKTDTDFHIADSIIKLGFYCKAELFVLPLHDLTKKYSDYRINVPGVVNNQNWAVKALKEDFSESNAEYLAFLTENSKRC